jgi:hypothetical protein
MCESAFRVPRLSVVVLGDELAIVYVLLLGSVGESRREVATLSEVHATSTTATATRCVEMLTGQMYGTVAVWKS